MDKFDETMDEFERSQLRYLQNISSTATFVRFYLWAGVVVLVVSFVVHVYTD